MRLRLSAALVASFSLPLAALATFPDAAAALDLDLLDNEGDYKVESYEKAVEGPDVVLNKLFPKKGKVELDVPKFGVVLNSSYIQTYLVAGGLNYFWSEEWGINFEGDYAITQDKNERTCIESFYNDPNFALNAQCGSASNLSQDPQGDANFGPAYVPIRQLKYVFSGNFVWNPIYGKQIVLLSATNYFDFYLLAGGGVAISNYYPERTNFPDGHPQRGTFCVKKDAAAGKCNPANNPGTNDPNLIGVTGRPTPIPENNVLMHIGIGQRFHFFKRFMVMGSLEDYTLLGTEQGYDNFLTIMGGLGVRF